MVLLTSVRRDTKGDAGYPVWTLPWVGATAAKQERQAPKDVLLGTGNEPREFINKD